ncbi:MAG: hypothetical protein JWL77_2227 [Chthonomonadaceae bacterium]|nr:hypothetical protein [Chthonomonadaceae bacterium]
MRSQVLEFRLCPNCTALMPVNAKKCARCKLSPAAAKPLRSRRSHLKHAMAHLRARRYLRKAIATGLCPNCRGVIARDARRCSECDWIRIDSRRELVSEKHRRLALSVRAALTYEKIRYCVHCTSRVRSSTDFCPLCQNAFLFVGPTFSLFARVGTHLRKQQARSAVERATLCPTCDIYLPGWSEQCYCCGWSRPPGTNMRTAFRYLVQSTRRKVRLTARRASHRVTTEDLCPTCEVYIPASDPMCMICGWKPVRKRSLRDASHALRAERANRAILARQKRLRICEECDLPLLPGDALCMVCGWKPAPNAAQRLLAVCVRARKAAVKGERHRLCPDCRISLEENARHCGACGWDRDPARSWARHPRMIWLVPICLVLYATVLITFLQMADPQNDYGHVDRYGRTGLEGKIKHLTSGRSH